MSAQREGSPRREGQRGRRREEETQQAGLLSSSGTKMRLAAPCWKELRGFFWWRGLKAVRG